MYKYKEHLGTFILQGRCLMEIIVLLIYSEASCLFIAFKVPPLQRWEASRCDYLFMCIPYAVQNDVIAWLLLLDFYNVYKHVCHGA